MAKKIKAAVVGAGFIGKHHVEGFLDAGAEVAAICDVDPARAASAAKACGAKPFTDYRRMLSGMPGIEAVGIAAPNRLHKPIAIAALKAGKHVICDKPMAASAAEAREMVEEARRRKRILTLHLQLRFKFSSKWLRKEIEKGALGEIYHAKASMLRVNAIPKGWFHVKKFSGGGVLLDLGPHVLDIAWVLMGRPRPLSAFGYSYSKLGVKGTGFGKWGIGYESGHRMDTDDFSGGIIRCAGGKNIEVETSWAAHLDEPTSQCTFFGDRAGAKLKPSARIFSQNRKLRVKEAPAGKDETPFEDFLRCIRTGKKPDARDTDGLAVMKMIDALYRSAAGGKEAKI